MSFSKRHILFVATVTILSAAISEGGVAGSDQSDRGIFSGVSKVFNWLKKTEAVGVCETCISEPQQTELQKRAVANFSDIAKNIHDVAIFCENPKSGKCRRDFAPELLENPQYNGIVLVDVSGIYKTVPLIGAGNNAKKPTKGEDGKYHSAGIGFMLNECLMITNQHVAYMGSHKENLTDLEIEVLQKRKGPSGVYNRTVRTSGQVVAKGEYIEGQDNRLRDVAVIKLNQNSPEKKSIIPICLVDETDALDVAATTASFYPDIKPIGTKLFGQEECQISGKKRATGGLWMTDCPVIEGASGSPVLMTIAKGPEKGKICSLGIMRGTTADENYLPKKTDEVFNTMVPFSSVFSQKELDEIKAKYKCVETTHL